MKTIFYLTASVSLLGARRSLLYTIRSLDRTLFRPVVVASREGPLADELRKLGVPVHFIWFFAWRKLRNALTRRWSVRRLRRLANGEGADLIHANDFSVNPYSVLAARALRVPTVCHLRGDIDRRHIRNYFVHEADRVITVSHANAASFDHWPEEMRRRVVTIYNGILPREYQAPGTGADIRREFGIGDDEVLVGMLGRLCERKNQLGLIRAMPEVLRRCPQTRFMLVGPAGRACYAQYVKRCLDAADELGVRDRLILTGQRDDVAAILDAANMVVLPSVSEGLPRTLLEAMCASLPVVASNVSGNPEAVEEGVNGFLVPPDAPRALADRIAELAVSPELRRRMGQAGLEKVNHEFALSLHGRGVLRLYDELTT